MKASLTARLTKLEQKDGGRLSVVWVAPGGLAEAEAEAEGRRVILVGWKGNDEE